MTNSKKLKELLESRGVSFSLVAKKIGMTRQGLHKKFEDGSDFKAYQMIIIKDLLRMTDEEARDIFFSSNVDS